MRTIQSPTQSRPQEARSPLFWLALGAVAVAQLLALWMLCSQQVRKAQARDTHVVQQALTAEVQRAPDSPAAGARPVKVSY